jgi:hypothetical protein
MKTKNSQFTFSETDILLKARVKLGVFEILLKELYVGGHLFIDDSVRSINIF